VIWPTPRASAYGCGGGLGEAGRTRGFRLAHHRGRGRKLRHGKGAYAGASLSRNEAIDRKVEAGQVMRPTRKDRALLSARADAFATAMTGGSTSALSARNWSPIEALHGAVRVR
jgi:hypothetical protein